MAGYNFSQNIIGLNKTNGDIHELEVEVANLSASVLDIKEVIDTKSSLSSVVSTTNPLAVNDTFQIPANLLTYKLLFVTLRRAGLATSLFLDTEKMGAGIYNYGICGYCNSANYYTITVSQTGLITLVAKSADLGEAHIDIIGIK